MLDGFRNSVGIKKGNRDAGDNIGDNIGDIMMMTKMSQLEVFKRLFLCRLAFPL